MLTSEENRVLAYLRRHVSATAADVARACLPGATPEWVGRVIANLDWFGYVTVYYGQAGDVRLLQITDRGSAPSV